LGITVRGQVKTREIKEENKMHLLVHLTYETDALDTLLIGMFLYPFKSIARGWRY
jgi:hypothetical protein